MRSSDVGRAAVSGWPRHLRATVPAGTVDHPFLPPPLLPLHSLQPTGSRLLPICFATGTAAMLRSARTLPSQTTNTRSQLTPAHLAAANSGTPYQTPTTLPPPRRPPPTGSTPPRWAACAAPAPPGWAWRPAAPWRRPGGRRGRGSPRRQRTGTAQPGWPGGLCSTRCVE